MTNNNVLDTIRSSILRDGTDMGYSYETLVELTAAVLNHVQSEHGGCRVYVYSPGVDERNKEIKERFDGSNWAELVRDTGLTVRQLRRIVNGG